MANGQPIRDYWIERSYNKRGLLKEETEMPKGKSTTYRYDSMQRLEQKMNPNYDEIDYVYDALGRLKALTSSNGTITYLYDYDLHDNIIKIEDHVHHITQIRSFDLYDRLEKEVLSPDVTIGYEYDKRDRLKKLILPDGSFISYVYRPHLTKIERHMPNGAISYAIECPTYDLRDNLLEIDSPAGKIHYTYDLLGRAVNVQSEHWESRLEHFDAAGNLKKIRQRDPNGTMYGEFTYDRFDHLNSESFHHSHQYAYDSLGNCLQKNTKLYQINALNQLKQDEESEYTYDSNGNLRKQSFPPATYIYDALNRLVLCEREGNHTHFLYDAFGRCLQITDQSGSKKLLYQGNQEIGSLSNGKIEELRLVHPDFDKDQTFVIELKGEPLFPIQDFRGNICALQKQDGSLAEWTRYTVFGEKVISGNFHEFNPWRFANRREVADISLFTHRFYNPRLMRWLTTDPLRFDDDLNLYTYVHNNPFCYKDPDGRFAFAIPLLVGAFGAGGITLSATTIGTIAGIAVGTTLGWGIYQGLKWVDNTYNQIEQPEQVQDEKEQGKRPPYCGEKLGKDPTKCPAEGFKWKGKGGPETGKGNWVKGKRGDGTLEELHPDLDHPLPTGPHWDYYGPNFPNGIRLKPDGTWEMKI